MDKKNFTLKKIIIYAIIVIIFSGLWYFAPIERFNLKYILWKEGLIGYYDGAYQIFYGDSNFRNKLAGKPKHEIFRLFPNLKPPGQGNRYQQDWLWWFSGKDAYWIGETNYGRCFR